MADDLEAFLRQAAQRRAQRQKEPRPQRPPTQRPTDKRQPARPTSVPPVVIADVVEAQVVTPESSRLGTRVTTSQFEQRAERLGEEVGLADETMEAHLHEKFDHQVGNLDLSKGEQVANGGPQPEPQSAAEALRELLQSPKGIRQAILLSEILSPPRERWT